MYIKIFFFINENNSVYNVFYNRKFIFEIIFKEKKMYIFSCPLDMCNSLMHLFGQDTRIA